MKGIKTLLATTLLTVACCQANAAASDTSNTNISIKNDSNVKVWVKFTLLYPSTDSCLQSFPSNEQFNVVLGPKDTTSVGPYDSSCHISITASPNNKFYYNCDDGRDVTTGVTTEIKVKKQDILSCKVS